MIKIFDENDRDFSTNGNIAIKPIKCRERKKKSLNGWYIDVEVDIKYADYILEDKLCVVKTKSKVRPQAFRIENPKKTNKTIIFTANHVMFDAKRYHLFDVRPTKQNGQNALSYINERTDNISPFTVFSNIEHISTAYFIRKNLLEAWAVLEERWDGVFDADNWDIKFLDKVGNDNGETISYGKNMQGIQIFEDWSNVCTKVCPVGYDGVTLPEEYLESDIKYKVPYTKTIDFETEIEDEEKTEDKLIEELRENANRYLENNKYPKVSYEVTSNVNQNMEIGDTIHVKHPLVNLQTEVLEYEHNILTGKIELLIFGNYTRDVKSKFDNIKENVQNLTEQFTKQGIVISKQTNIINTLNKTGYVYIDENEILILDALPREIAKNVWRFGLGGIGFSSNGYEGPFETAITMDGQINANFITTGVMSVDRIEGLFEQISIVVSNNMKDTNDTLEELQKKHDELKIQLDGLTNTLSDTGGVNLLRNSVGYFDDDYWIGDIVTINSTEVKNNSISGNALYLQNASISQEIQVKNGTYNVSFIYKKVKSAATCKVKINGTAYELTSSDVYEFEKSIEITNHTIKIEFEADTINSCWITDLLVILGNKKQTWTQNQNETTSDTVKIGKGIQVESSSTNTYTRIDSDGNRTYNKTTGEVVSEQTDKGTLTKELIVKELANICGCVVNNVDNQVWFSVV